MNSVVNALGAVAGTIWICAALYFQMLRSRSVHPAYVATLFLIGVALMMSSSALALRGPKTIELFAVIGNALFIGLGIGVWYILEKAAELQDRKAACDEEHTA